MRIALIVGTNSVAMVLTLAALAVIPALTKSPCTSEITLIPIAHVQ